MKSKGSGQRPYGADRRMEIVSGKNASGVGSNQIFSGTRSRTPDLPAGSTRKSQASSNSSSNSKSKSKSWGFNFTDPEMERKKRIAKYKLYSVEGNMKASLRKGLRWIKNKCSQIVRGY